MKKLSYLLYVIGIIQIILGIFYLFFPQFILMQTGHNHYPTDIYYPLAMLASRFIAYGLAFLYIAREPVKYNLWIKFMVLIQLIDLGAGLFYTLTGVVQIGDSAFPMFNALWISILLILWQPEKKDLP